MRADRHPCRQVPTGQLSRRSHGPDERITDAAGKPRGDDGGHQQRTAGDEKEVRQSVHGIAHGPDGEQHSDVALGDAQVVPLPDGEGHGHGGKDDKAHVARQRLAVLQGGRIQDRRRERSRK